MYRFETESTRPGPSRTESRPSVSTGEGGKLPAVLWMIKKPWNLDGGWGDTAHLWIERVLLSGPGIRSQACSISGIALLVMDTSSPAVFVNAELLRMYPGRRVRAVIQVLQSDGGTMTGQSTDGHQLLVKGSQTFPKLHFVEVIGIADGNQSIRAEICTDFGESFDAASYNRLCQLANGDHKNLFL